MMQTMTQQQLDTYLETNGYGISSENGNVSYISDKKGDIIAMFWKGKESYLETLEEVVYEDAMDPTTWNRSQYKNAGCSAALGFVAFALMMIVIAIFG